MRGHLLSHGVLLQLNTRMQWCHLSNSIMELITVILRVLLPCGTCIKDVNPVMLTVA